MWLWLVISDYDYQCQDWRTLLLGAAAGLRGLAAALVVGGRRGGYILVVGGRPRPRHRASHQRRPQPRRLRRQGRRLAEAPSRGRGGGRVAVGALRVAAPGPGPRNLGTQNVVIQRSHDRSISASVRILIMMQQVSRLNMIQPDSRQRRDIWRKHHYHKCYMIVPCLAVTSPYISRGGVGASWH